MNKGTDFQIAVELKKGSWREKVIAYLGRIARMKLIC